MFEGSLVKMREYEFFGLFAAALRYEYFLYIGTGETFSFHVHKSRNFPCQLCDACRKHQSDFIRSVCI